MKKTLVKICCFCFGFLFAMASLFGLCDRSDYLKADSEGVTSVTQISDITETGVFVLENDLEVSQASEIDFSGTLDGNNKTITLKGVNLFSSLNGANIKNLTIVFEANEEISISSNFGILASSSQNTKISQVCLVVDSENEINVKADGSLNFGLLIGSALYGTEISNLEVRANNKIIVTQLNSSSVSTSFGAICGKLENSTIKNVVCSSDLELNVVTDELGIFTTELNLGGLFGYLEGKKTCVINAVVNSELSSYSLFKEETEDNNDNGQNEGEGDEGGAEPASLEVETDDNGYIWSVNSKINAGAFIGQVTDSVNAVPEGQSGGTISKLVSCSSESTHIGKSESFVLDEEEYLLNQRVRDFSIKSNYQNFANLVSEWNFDEIWKENDEEFITLQRFYTYNLSVNNSVNSYGLNTTTKPLKPVLDIELSGGTAGDESGMDFAYGAKPIITATFANIGSSEISYNFFFEVGRLMANGNLVDAQFETKVDEDIVSYCWTLDGVTLSSQGEYTIELVPKVYSIKVQTEDTLKGKVRNYLVASDAFSLTNISYGGTYTVYSVAEKYFASNGWKIGEDSVQDAQILSNTTLTFAFSDNDDFTLTHLISRLKDDDGYLATIDAVFTNSFLTIDFVIMLDGKNINDTSDIVIMVNDERLVVDSENKLQTKVTLGLVKISIDNLPDSSVYTYSLDGHSNSEATSFSFTPNENETTGTREFVINLTSIEEDKDNSWIWWLVGAGGILVVGGSVAAIVIIRKNKDNSYKKMY